MLKSLKISFDEAFHVYTSDDVEVPSVSKIIQTSKYFSFLPPKKQIEVIYKGAVLHQNIDFYLSTGETMGDALLQDFAITFHHLKKKYGNLILNEKPLGASYNDMPFAGKPDIILEGAVIEIKSKLGSAERIYSMQLGGYSLLCEANEITKTDTYIICYRSITGFTYKVLKDKYANMTPKEAFLVALERFHYKERYMKAEDLITTYLKSL